MRQPLQIEALLEEIRECPDAAAELAQALAPLLEPDRRAPEFLTTEEVAVLLRCSRQRVHRLVYERKLKPQHDGRRTLFPRRAVGRYLEGEA